MSTKRTVESLSNTLDAFIAEVNDRFAQVHDGLARALENDDVISDREIMALRVEAVKEATIRLRVIGDSVSFGDDAPAYVDEVLKVASFLLAEQATAAVVNNYNDHYHYDVTAAPAFSFDMTGPEDADRAAG